MTQKLSKADAETLIAARARDNDKAREKADREKAKESVHALLDLRAALEEDGGDINVTWACGRIERALQLCAPSKAKARMTPEEMTWQLVEDAVRGVLMQAGIAWDHLDPLTDEVIEAVRDHGVVAIPHRSGTCGTVAL